MPANEIFCNLSFFGLQHFAQLSHPFFKEKTMQQEFFTMSMRMHEDILMVLIHLGFCALLIKKYRQCFVCGISCFQTSNPDFIQCLFFEPFSDFH